MPAGAFILFGGDAWDLDYDWIGEAAAHPGTVPAEIIALEKRGAGRRRTGGPVEPSGPGAVARPDSVLQTRTK